MVRRSPPGCARASPVLTLQDLSFGEISVVPPGLPVISRNLCGTAPDEFEHSMVEELGLLPIWGVTALRHDHELVIRHLARNHPHNRRGSEHIRVSGHKQGPDFQRLELVRCYDIHQTLSGPP